MPTQFGQLGRAPAPAPCTPRRRYASWAAQFHPRWGSIRFRLAPRTYDAPPCGPSVRVVRLTKSRKIPTRKIFTALFRVQATHRRPHLLHARRRRCHPRRAAVHHCHFQATRLATTTTTTAIFRHLCRAPLRWRGQMQARRWKCAPSRQPRGHVG